MVAKSSTSEHSGILTFMNQNRRVEPADETEKDDPIQQRKPR